MNHNELLFNFEQNLQIKILILLDEKTNKNVVGNDNKFMNIKMI